MTGLKLVYGGSIPSFLVSLAVLARRLALQMCDREEGTRAVILRLCLLVQLIRLLV